MNVINDFYKKKIKNNQLIKIIGRVKFNRSNNKITFLSVNDGTNFLDLQIVCKKENLDNYMDIVNVSLSSIVGVDGVFKLTPNSKQKFEIIANKVEILSLCASGYPLQKKKHSNEFLREIADLRIRVDKFNAIFRIRHSALYAIHEFFHKNDFINVSSPIITNNDAEGAGTTFLVTTRTNDNDYKKDFFGKKAFLTVSGQLNAESYAQAFRNVYTFGPTFRAENSNTTRHAAEFWMVEPEMAFSDINDTIRLTFKFLKYVFEFILKNNKIEIDYLTKNVDKNLKKRLEENSSSDFIVITYTEAIDILNKAKNKNVKFANNNIKWGMDLQTEHEKYICEIVYKKPTFVKDYPVEIKSFYMKLNDDNKTVAGFDLLVPGIGELIGGSQREDDYDKIIMSCNKKNIETKSLEWYLNLRKYGYYKSTGFGLGFERLIMYLTGINNIRDVIPFPRTPKNLLF